MEATAARQAREKAVNPAASRQQTRPAPEDSTESCAIGYGMPCAKCRAYYPADMAACPICKSRERVSPKAVPPVAAAAPSSHSEEAKRLAEERERLRELKSQIYASQPGVSAPAAIRCALDQNHTADVEPAAICHTCYGELRQQADRMEQALHMDPKEATKIIYDAVWADTSDPNRTYANAAVAILAELQGRAGLSSAPGKHKP